MTSVSTNEDAYSIRQVWQKQSCASGSIAGTTQATAYYIQAYSPAMTRDRYSLRIPHLTFYCPQRNYMNGTGKGSALWSHD